MQQIIYLKLILTMAIWGGTFVVGRMISQTLDPFASGFGRFAIASISIALSLSYRGDKLERLNCHF